jgi:hypothetical protein
MISMPVTSHHVWGHAYKHDTNPDHETKIIKTRTWHMWNKKSIRFYCKGRNKKRLWLKKCTQN